MDSDGQALLEQPPQRQGRLLWPSILAAMLSLMAVYTMVRMSAFAPGQGEVGGTMAEFEVVPEHRALVGRAEVELADVWLPEKMEQLSKLLPALRAQHMHKHKLRVKTNQSEAPEDIKKQILAILPSLSEVSPVTAVQMGVAITAEDLAMLGFSEPLDDVKGYQDDSAEGVDMIRTLEDRRLNIAYGEPWPNGRIPFCFHREVPQAVKIQFVQAIHEWEKAVGCLNFQQLYPRPDGEKRQGCHGNAEAITVTFEADGNWIWGLGRSARQLNLDNEGGIGPHIGIIMHELGHALGMKHEHQRPDRDRYITIHWENIATDRETRYQWQEEPLADSVTKYDILSIMHYSSNHGRWFSANGRSCHTYDAHSVACDLMRDSVGQRVGLTQLDADTIGNLYQTVNPLCKSSLSRSTPWFDPDVQQEGGFPKLHMRQWMPRTTERYNTIHAREIGYFACKPPGTSWRTDGHGTLAFDHSGRLVFIDVYGHATWGTPVRAGTDLCFQSDGNLVIYRNGKAIWDTATYAKPGTRKAHKILLFDRHFALQTELKYGSDPNTWSLVRFPPQAPSSIEIIPWNGCLTEMIWSTPGGAQLGFKDGNLWFLPGNGNGHAVYPATWNTGSVGMGKCVTFIESGQLAVWPEDGPFLFRTGTDGARSPHKATRIVVFDNEWAMFDHEYRVIVTYPPSTEWMRLDHWSARK